MRKTPTEEFYYSIYQDFKKEQKKLNGDDISFSGFLCYIISGKIVIINNFIEFLNKLGIFEEFIKANEEDINNNDFLHDALFFYNLMAERHKYLKRYRLK